VETFGLPTKTAQHKALRDGSYGTFLQNIKRRLGYVEEIAKIHFQVVPKECLDRLGIEDPTVNRLLSEVQTAESAITDFQRRIKKVADLPSTRT
jgi:hypothetical protein